MPPAIYLGRVNERGGGGATSIPDTPITPRLLTYISLVGRDGAAAIAIPPQMATPSTMW